jgi:outer membrane protein OmpA-like peptidoglycan-associated protein
MICEYRDETKGSSEMRKTVFAIVVIALLAAGCGVNQDYVNQQVADSEGRTNTKLSDLSDRTEATEAELNNLKSLASQLSDKTDLAINKAKGFESYQVLWTGEVNFDYDSYVITDIAAGIVSEAGSKLESVGGSIIEIVGHTDATGSQSYNYLLAEKRSHSVKRFLSERFGISLYRMFVVGMGEDKPVALPDERNANARNRRVVLTIWGQP